MLGEMCSPIDFLIVFFAASAVKIKINCPKWIAIYVMSDISDTISGILYQSRHKGRIELYLTYHFKVWKCYELVK